MVPWSQDQVSSGRCVGGAVAQLRMLAVPVGDDLSVFPSISTALQGKDGCGVEQRGLRESSAW